MGAAKRPRSRFERFIDITAINRCVEPPADVLDPFTIGMGVLIGKIDRQSKLPLDE